MQIHGMAFNMLWNEVKMSNDNSNTFEAMIRRTNNRNKVGDFKILSVTILKESNPKLLKTLRAGSYSFYDKDISNDFFAHNVNISAIVGKNGAGKSSLLDIIFRMVNNFSAYLVGNSMKRKSADVIYYIPGIYSELHYQMGDKKGVLYNYDNVVALSFGEKKHLLSDRKLMKDSRFDDFEDCYRSSSTKRKEIAKSFFYTVVMNYALQAYNSSDYQDEMANGFETVDKIGNDSFGNWMNSLFHKNDGYASPIVLNPYRNDGVIDMKTETNLTRSRLVGIMIEAEKKNRGFIDGYRLHHIEFKFNPYRIILKMPKRFHKEDFVSFENMFRHNYSIRDSIARCVLRNYGINMNETSSLFVWACVYLVYKTLSITSKYPSYADYVFFGDWDIIDGRLRDDRDGERLEKLIKEILNDKSHITTKIRQTLFFLKNFKTKNLNDKAFYYSYYERWLGKEKENSSLVATMELLPPPIFDSEIYLRRQGEREEIPFYKLSSGERQFLFMMSSVIYHVLNIKSVPTSRVAYRYLNIVLDEVEMCFHPEYQRTFIYNLLNAIERLHLNTYCSFNIIITTHSPFLLSDIPQSNVLYLENGEVVDKSKMQNPFAANVNDILYQSFFLSNGFMGEFAKQKIVKMVNDANNNKFDEQKARELVGLVGEPILKERLKDLIEESLQ